MIGNGGDSDEYVGMSSRLYAFRGSNVCRWNAP